MARIRTIKPEFCQSLSLAEVSVAAERTFFGLISQADDEGRYVDHAAIINGALWPLRPEHTPVHCEDDLQQLADAGLICRYTGCDRRSYLHIVKWHEHQKISHASASRLPSCPEHERERRCGKCKAERCARPTPEGLGKAPEAAPPPVPAQIKISTAAFPTSAGTGPQGRAPADGGRAASAHGEAAGRVGPPESLQRVPEDPAPGSWTMDRGPSPKGGGVAAPSPAPSPAAPNHREPVPVGTAAPPRRVTTQDLVAEYVRGCRTTPPAKVRGHLAKEISKLLDEGFTSDQVRAGLERYQVRPLSPSLLPDMVHEAANARPARTGPSTARSPYQPFTNPEDVRAAYEGEL